MFYPLQSGKIILCVNIGFKFWSHGIAFIIIPGWYRAIRYGYFIKKHRITISQRFKYFT